ncbi:MAG TPA: 2-hydroxyacyl-CoA dehydratase family protein, partial [Armatimonadota bacterium]|nr:2-hydroxyacyl-CoA dehydratase family protein [Armatimonadota bacterium]
MKQLLKQITLEEWDKHYKELHASGLKEPWYGGPISRHVEDGDLRLLRLVYDPSPAALRLWNFLLTEEDRLREYRAAGKKLIGTMKDLGTVPVMVYTLPNAVAFYPDGAWWIPCVMEMSEGLFAVADSLGLDESFCPVRAMIGAFITEAHFPIPDLLISSVGATCDDFSAIAQRLEGLGHPILWWEIPNRRNPDKDEADVELPGGFVAPKSQVEQVKSELERIRLVLEQLCGGKLNDEALSVGIRTANKVRSVLNELRSTVYTAPICPMPALEMLISEMLAIHFCSDRDEAFEVLSEVLAEARHRVSEGIGVLPEDAVRVFWVNPVADLRVMNLLERCGGRICGTDYLFTHALDTIPEDLPPMEALARMALADPMVGSTFDRVMRICHDVERFGAEAVIVSRIPGASHCATEGMVIAEYIKEQLGIPVVEIEVPPITDSMRPTLSTRIEALIETVRERRK